MMNNYQNQFEVQHIKAYIISSLSSSAFVLSPPFYRAVRCCYRFRYCLLLFKARAKHAASSDDRQILIFL